MDHTTGFTRDEIIELCAHVHAVNETAAEAEKITWPPILGLYKSVVVALTCLRRNGIFNLLNFGLSMDTWNLGWTPGAISAAALRRLPWPCR
jgi:hypothetical protein